jgi:phosphatidylglycerophosphate synthase
VCGRPKVPLLAAYNEQSEKLIWCVLFVTGAFSRSLSDSHTEMFSVWYVAEMFVRSKIAAIGASCYAFLFCCALLYSQFDHRTFSGLVAVVLTLPWSDYISGEGTRMRIVGCAILNTVMIYLIIAVVSRLPSIFRRLTL